jgi:hypothetical protein
MTKKSKSEELLELIDTLDIFEMAANLKQEDTGLPFIIWASTKESSGTEIGHGPRVKVQVNHAPKARKELMISLSISDDPQFVIKKPRDQKLLKSLASKDQKLAKAFVLANKDTLLAYWNDEIGTKKMLDDLKIDSEDTSND